MKWWWKVGRAKKERENCFKACHALVNSALTEPQGVE